ncbi:hypothetical protein LguiB_030371 [Lonicera macranthoides]
MICPSLICLQSPLFLSTLSVSQAETVSSERGDEIRKRGDVFRLKERENYTTIQERNAIILD